MLYKIIVSGCDDSTKFVMELSEMEYITVKKVADLCTEMSTYSCMPTMNIEEQRD